MEVPATMGGSILSAVIESVIMRIDITIQDHWVGFRLEIWNALQNLQATLSTIIGLVSHAEKKTHFGNDQGVNSWVASLQDAIYDADCVLDELEYTQLNEKLRKQNKSTWYFCKYKVSTGFEQGIIANICKLDKRLKDLLQLAASYKLEVVVNQLKSNIYGINSHATMATSFLDNKTEVFDGDAITDYIVQLLTQENPVNIDEPILSIICVDRIENLTLAKTIYDNKTINCYFNLKIWVYGFDEREMVRRILKSLNYPKGENTTHENYECLEALTKTLAEKLQGKKLFLILYDAHDENPSKWQSLVNFLQVGGIDNRSKVLVTTRSKSIADNIKFSRKLHLDGLPHDVFWPLFQKCIFDTTGNRPPELEEIAKNIMNKLMGSRLAAKTVGYILRSNPNKQHWEDILNSEVWMLPQNENSVMPYLILSYQYLPQHLKPCFAYCSLYPKGYLYGKKDIVHMWMALGYIQNQHQMKLLEEIGEEYLNDLLNRSMFQTCTASDVSSTEDPSEVFKIHDWIHDLAKMVSANDSLMIKDECTLKHFSSSIRHLSVFVDDDNWNWNGLNDFGNLNSIRTLIFLGKRKTERLVESRIPDDLYVCLQRIVSKMKFLRILDLSYFDIKNLPFSKLNHLRYLNVCRTAVRKLPRSSKHLYQLQVLNCEELQSLSQIKYMENLRHACGFHVNAGAIPNLQKFRFLQDLAFDVSKHQKLKVFQGMKDMRELSIYKLENIERKDEASEAELKSMDHLMKLTLCWSENSKGNNVEEVLESLHPGPNITVLELKYYSGTECPSWMENLSSLQTLSLLACRNIKFLRTRELRALKYLGFLDCDQLGIQVGFQGFQTLTSLEDLHIQNCPQLAADLLMEARGGLPSSLKNLSLWYGHVNASTSVMQSLTNLTSLDINFDSGSMTPSPIRAPKTQQLQKLRELQISCTSAQALKEWLLCLHGCMALVIIGLCCKELELFDNEMEDALVSFDSLRELYLGFFRKCRSLPTRLCEISSLEELRITCCSEIESLPERGLPGGLQLLSVEYSDSLAKHVEEVQHDLPNQLCVDTKY